MIQDIYPHVFSNRYFDKKPGNDDIVLFYQGRKVLVKHINNELHYPQYSDIQLASARYTYLFKIDTIDFYLAHAEQNIEIPGYCFEDIMLLRRAVPKHLDFACITAYHLNCWYQNNRYCGRCGHDLEASTKERMLFCSNCKNTIYPKISPVVIVAVTNGERLLMTKYANREYKKYALIAGFIELGESAEEAVKREVLEEAGLMVKNVTYYKSQPWGFSESLLLGYFAELDGDASIVMDSDELSEAVWVHRDDIDIKDDGVSLTNEMIRRFKMGYSDR